MFGREAVPATVPATLVKEPRPTREARAFQPSSFATRRAAAERAEAERNAVRLVSLGESEFSQRDQRTGEIEIYPVEILFDVDHPVDRYAAFPGHELMTLNPGGVPDDVTPLPPLRQGFGRPQTSAYPAALPEAPPVRIQ